VESLAWSSADSCRSRLVPAHKDPGGTVARTVATLLEFVDLLGPDVVHVVTAPLGLEMAVGEVVLYDPYDSRSSATGGELVLGIGLVAGSPAALGALQPPPVALVLKHDGEPDETLLAQALAHGVAVLTVARSTSWSRLAELASSLAAQPEGLQPADVPTSSGLVEELFAVANAVATRVEAPITIEDTQSRLLAYSVQHDRVDAARAATILGHRVPAEYREEVRRLGVAKRLLTETEPILVPTAMPGIYPRVVIALRARGQVLGSMWALTDGPFDADRSAAFLEAAQNVSLRLWQHRLATDLQHRQRSRSLTVVLAGGPAAVEIGRRAGLEADGYRLVGATLRPGPAERRHHLDRLRDVLSAQLSARRPANLVADLGDEVYAVLPASAVPEQSARDAHDVAQKLREGLQDEALLVAVSGHCASLAAMPQAWEEVQAVLRVLAEDPLGRWEADVEAVGLEVVLRRLVELQGDRSLLRNRRMEAIIEHDQQHGTEYLQTLEAHLLSFGDATVAAARLNVHPNTFRYRLRRLGEMFELDLDDADTRFALMVQFRLGWT